MSELKYLREDEREWNNGALLRERLNEARAKMAEIHAITQTQVQELWQANVLLSQIAMKARTDIPAPPEEPK